MEDEAVRGPLAELMHKRRGDLLRRLLAHIHDTPELGALREQAQTPDYQNAVTELLELLAANIADPLDRRCFDGIHQRALARFRQDFSAVQILSLAAMYRQVLHDMVEAHFGGGGDADLLRDALDLIEAQANDLELTLAAAYQTTRDQQWHVSESKYHSLFENASEAIISFTPGEGIIVDANVQAERSLGRPRSRLLGTPFADLFTTENREQALWLASQKGGSSNLRFEDMEMVRSDGAAIPISLSCNWVSVEGVSVAQAIIRDVTQLRQMQRELQNYAEQLEIRVADRTSELQESEERYRLLFLQEQRRARHLSLINDVQQCALATREVDEFVHLVASSVQLHFRECDVIFYLCRIGNEDELNYRSLVEVANPELARERAEAGQGGGRDCVQLMVAAESGGHGLGQPVGAVHPLGQGLPGEAALHRETLYIANDTTTDPRYMRPPGVHRDALSELCVPVIIEGEILGVIAVLGPVQDAFDPRDAVALQTAAIIAASHIRSSRLVRDMREIKEFGEALVRTMRHSMMVVGPDGTIQIVNERLCETLRTTRDELINQPVSRAFSQQVIERHSIDRALQEVMTTKLSEEVPEVRVWTGDTELVFDLRLSRVYFRNEAHAVVLLVNITERWRKAQQLQLMNEMGRFLQASLDFDRVLHTVLTCITAGPALGFNRAFLLLLDEDTQVLQGAMALGPSSAEEASQIWRDLGQRQLSLQEMLADESAFDSANPTPLQQRIRTLGIDMRDPALGAVALPVRESRALKLRREALIGDGGNGALGGNSDPDSYEPAHAAIRELFTAPEVAIAPLVAQTKIVGIVMADNLYSGTPIEEDDLRLLDTVARQAGLTVDNARTYQDLQKAQRELVAGERLVAVGEMAARISHEIRNPLATVGGFARSMLRKPESPEAIARKAGIIVDEVARLEELLNDLLDMARARDLELRPNKLNEVVEHALLLADADIKANRAEIVRELAPDLPIAWFDRRRMLQALLNTIRNGAQSMQGGGVLRIATRLRHGGAGDHLEIEIQDHGVGIPERARKQIFDPFFSTKIRGSGLGLAVTLRIVRDHGGDIDVFSEEGQGTTFVMSLPLNLPLGDETD